MFYLQNFRVQLQERRNRLHRCGYETYDAELRYFFQFLDSNTYTRSLMALLDTSNSIDFGQWAEEHATSRSVEFPMSEEGRAKVCHGILKRLNGNGEWLRWCRLFSSETKYDAMFRDLTESVVDPFVNFLHDQIDESGNVLYVIERFKLKAEWFGRRALYDIYLEDTSRGEARLDLELRAALFDGGIDYPFSQPSSPSGKADIVALLGSNDPLVLEVKVFDPSKSRGTNHLRQGFHQVLRYANDYNQSLGYLVIFNSSENQLVISHEESPETEFPLRVSYAGKTLFLITIDIHPDIDSASKEKPSNRRAVSVKDLVGEPGPT